MKHLLAFVPFLSSTTGAFALVGKNRRENNGLANNAPDPQAHDQGWKTPSWHESSNDAGRKACTVTVTVVVTQTAGPVPTNGAPYGYVTPPYGNLTAPYGNATAPADDSSTTTPIGGLASVTSFNTSTFVSAAATTTDDSALASTATDDLASITSVSATAVESSGDGAAATTSILYLSPLIDVSTLGISISATEIIARAPKETGK